MRMHNHSVEFIIVVLLRQFLCLQCVACHLLSSRKADRPPLHRLSTTVIVKMMSTLMDYCGIIYSPRNVYPGFKWYRCSLVFVLNTTAYRLSQSCKSSGAYDVCFVNKLFLQFKCYKNCPMRRPWTY
jgi:hypothetical protein